LLKYTVASAEFDPAKTEDQIREDQYTAFLNLRCNRFSKRVSKMTAIQEDFNNVTVYLDTSAPFVELGVGNKSLVLRPWVSASPITISTTPLKTGGGTLSLQRQCFVADEARMVATILSTKESFPFENKAFLSSLKGELETEYNITFSLERLNCTVLQL